ncbi:putative bifunctional diguanylate cyclase/phosphodiesterase [Nitrincola sp. MINF-07-Sa-05]|uniref:putative bifunctional diguanylate cyclase/phosphodiesterase n=1 Tax=Nitrincola salilacus TaxID=3400273 RepID=UPI00391826EB
MDQNTAIKLLNQRIAMEKLISRISSSLVLCSPHDLDDGITHVLAQIAEFTHTDRTYLFQIRDVPPFADNTHEWCADRIASQKANLQNIPFTDDFRIAGLIRQHKTVFIEDVDQLPAEWAADKELLSSQSIQSMLAVPMLSDARLVGFIGIDSVWEKRNWSGDDISLLRITGEIITHTLERKRAQEMLQERESRFRYLFEQIPSVAVQGYDSQRRVFMWNKASELLYGYSAEEAQGRCLEELIIPHEARELVVDAHRKWVQDGQPIPAGEEHLLRKDGSRVNVFSSHVMNRTLAGDHEMYCVDVDLTELKQAMSIVAEREKQLEKLAHFDPLTGLPNRILLSDRLRQMMSHSKRSEELVAVAYLDLDGFKQVNDSFGHELGDELLRQVSVQMEGALREQDTLARIGGDEFVAVIGGLSQIQECEPILQRLLATAADTYVINGQYLNVSASIGVTFYPLDPVEADQLVRHADQAMYQAKQAGKNRYQLFDVRLEEEIREKQSLIWEINRALSRGEFVLYYQPKINMRSGEFIGAEALIRWQHPEKGLLSPAAFMPVTEDQQIGIDLGKWVLNQALSQMHTWRSQGFNCPVSINISARHIQQRDFTSQLASALQRYPELSASDLDLEILETSALEDIQLVTQVMEECHALGVTFSLDDFGTGYSSLSYLKRLPIDCLKIDQSFVRGMLEDQDDLSIIQGVMGLAWAFGLKAIAEGVETPAHGQQLLTLGCELAQGYGIARPMPADRLPVWVEEELAAAVESFSAS